MQISSERVSSKTTEAFFILFNLLFQRRSRETEEQGHQVETLLTVVEKKISALSHGRSQGNAAAKRL